jgi:hypothetical protein
MDLESILRPRRKPLVIAAEAAIAAGRNELPNKSQLSRLIAICGEATCTEEIDNYLRYQASRDGGPWKIGFVELVLSKIKPVLDNLQPDPVRVAAWRLYAVFLTRALTYEQEIKRGRAR